MALYLVHIDWNFGNGRDIDAGYEWSIEGAPPADRIEDIFDDDDSEIYVCVYYDPTVVFELFVELWVNRDIHRTVITPDSFRYLTGPSPTLYAELSRLRIKL